MTTSGSSSRCCAVDGAEIALAGAEDHRHHVHRHLVHQAQRQRLAADVARRHRDRAAPRPAPSPSRPPRPRRRRSGRTPRGATRRAWAGATPRPRARPRAADPPSRSSCRTGAGRSPSRRSPPTSAGRSRSDAFDTFSSPVVSSRSPASVCSPLPYHSKSGPTWSFSSAMKPSTDTTLCITTLPITSPIVNLLVETGSGPGTHRISHRSAAIGPSLPARDVVLEEDLADQFAPAAHTGLVRRST